MTSIKQKEKDKKGLIVNTLVVRPLNRRVLDVGQWRTALKSADVGLRFQLYQLYQDILLDTVLSKAIEKRVNAITNAELRFMKDEEPVQEMEDLMDSPVFEDILIEIMNSRFWGKTVMELDFRNGLQAYNIPREHIRPEKGIIVVNPNDDTGIPYRGDDFFLEAGGDKDFGLLLKVSPFAIYKRGGFGDWAQFAELFGMPFKKGTYSSQDESSRQILEEALEKSGSNAWIVHPKETEIDIVETKSTGNTDLFDKLRRACNEEMLVGILGQTMTTIAGSSRAQSETHKEVEEDVNKADRRFVQRILNTELKPRLEKRGWPVQGGSFTFPDAGENVSMKDQILIDDALQNKLGVQIDKAFLSEYYGRPVSTEKTPANPPAYPPVPDPNKKPVKKDKKRKLADKLTVAESSFWIKLKEGFGSFFVQAPFMGAEKLAGDLLTDLNLADLPLFDSEALARRVSEGSDYFDPELFNYTSANLLKALHLGFAQKNFASIGIEYGYTPDAYKTAMEINLFQFSAAKDLSEIQKLNEAFRASTGWADFLSRACEISGEFNETWLRTEYDTAYLTSESSAAYYRLMAQKDIFPYWQYITMDDGRVREEHLKLHGLVLECIDKLWDKIYPPNGWRCRCRVRPLMKNELPAGYNKESERARVNEFFNTSDWKNNVAQGWGVNRALTAEVFSANQMYIRKFPTKAASYLNKLTSEKWGLQTIPKLKEAAGSVMPVSTIGESEIWKNESKDGIISLKLYDDRTLELSEKSFIKHTKNKKDNRINLWSALKETLLNPNEIWLNDNSSPRFDNFNLIKYYNDKVIVANYKVEKGKLVLKTWYELQTEHIGNMKPDLKKTIWDKKRRGLLIKRPNS
jgi:SPP1 gp7 family putative phage head morphogenesis protein